jgi:hypothetical protein
MCRAQMLEAIFWQALRHLVLNIGPINCSAAFRLPGKHHIMVHLSFLSYNIFYIVYSYLSKKKKHLLYCLPR